MFVGALNVHLGGELMKSYSPKLTVIRKVDHTVYSFFNDITKVPMLNNIITAHKSIYNLFGSVIYHKPHYIFKWKSYEYHNRNIGLFSGNDTRMSGYFRAMNRDLSMIKALLATVSSAEFRSMIISSKLSKVVLYIYDNKSWDRCYVLFKLFPLYYISSSIRQ